MSVVVSFLNNDQGNSTPAVKNGNVWMLRFAIDLLNPTSLLRRNTNLKFMNEMTDTSSQQCIQYWGLIYTSYLYIYTKLY
jgi:hypothetical protein